MYIIALQNETRSCHFYPQMLLLCYNLVCSWDCTDFVDNEYTDWKVRPNQLFAVSLPYTCLPEDIRKAVIDKIESELLTDKGIRTLSPKNPDYKGVFEGNENERKLAYHQGSVRPWLFGHFAEAYLNIYQKSGVGFIKQRLQNFEQCMHNHGIGSLSEIHDGNPPHKPNGSTSFALSVAEILRITELIKNYEN